MIGGLLRAYHDRRRGRGDQGGRLDERGRQRLPEAQILTVAGLSSHAEATQIPPQGKRSPLGYKAERQARSDGTALPVGRKSPPRR